MGKGGEEERGRGREKREKGEENEGGERASIETMAPKPKS